MTRLIGLVGGMSWQSTALYYARLNQFVNDRLGAHHNARSVLVTLDFEELLAHARIGDWASVATAIGAAARTVQAAGAEFVMITAMTGHAVAGEVANSIGIPLLHAGDVLVEAATSQGCTRIGLLGTDTTLTGTFLTDRLGARGITPIIPGEAERQVLDRIILEELALGVTCSNSRTELTGIAQALIDQGADAVVLACTELPLLISRDALPVPILDLVDLHVAAAVDWSLNGIPTRITNKATP